jgi:hypothetical protein
MQRFIRNRARFLVAIALTAVLGAACDDHALSGPLSGPGSASDPLASIAVSPNASMNMASNQQMTAVGLTASGKSIAVTPVWSVAASGGTISTSGVFTSGMVAGTFTNTVVATVGSITGHASITVMAGALASIAILPTPVTLAGNTAQTFTATGKDAGGNTIVITPVWSVVAGGGAITAAGVFTSGTTLGTFTNTVQATSGGISAFATVTVTAGSLFAVTVAPASASLAFNGTQQFVATGRDSLGNAVTITPVWSVAASGGAISPTWWCRQRNSSPLSARMRRATRS